MPEAGAEGNGETAPAPVALETSEGKRTPRPQRHSPRPPTGEIQRLARLARGMPRWSKTTVREALRGRHGRGNARRDDSVFVMGEEVAEYQGGLTR